MSEKQENSGSHQHSPLADLESSLRFTTQVARLCLVAHRIALILAVFIVGGMAVGVLDYLVRTPWLLRSCYLAVGICVNAWVMLRYVLPALRFQPTLIEMALRLEGTDRDGSLGLKGNLTSALELARSQHLVGVGKSLAHTLVTDLAARTRSMRVLGRLIAPATSIERTVIVLLTLIPMLVLTLKAPEMARIGCQRVLTPWTSVQWPKRYSVSDATVLAIHPSDAALPLRAVLLRSPNDPGKSDVSVSYRTIADDGTSEWQRVLLTGQGSLSAELSASLGGTQGELYERLLEPASIDARLATLTQRTVILEYTISAGDDTTEPRQIILARPPTIAQSSVSVTPPDYVQVDDAFPFVHGQQELSATDTSRGTVGPILAGSRISLALDFSKPIPLPAPETFASSALGLTDAAGITAVANGKTWTLSWIAREPLKFSVSVKDEHGLSLAGANIFRFESVGDATPTVAVVAPAADESVLPTAEISIRTEARDDVALKTSGAQSQIFTLPTSTESRALVKASEPGTLADGVFDNGPRHAVTQTLLDLSKLPLKAGDEVWITAVATDVKGRRDTGDPASDGTVRSAPRKLRIISDSEFVEQLRGELNSVRQAAIRLEQDQQANHSKTQALSTAQDAAEAQRRQDAISERLNPASEALSRLKDRFERNHAADHSLESLITDAQTAVRSATGASREAGESLKQAASSGDKNPLSPDAAARAAQAGKQQEQVARELDRLVDMLSQTQDSWAARRQLEKMLEQQKRLTQEARQAGTQTAGKSAQELPPQAAAELNHIAQEQKDLARAVQKLVDDLESQAQSAAGDKSRSQAQAQVLKEAAQKGRSGQTAEKQQKAAEQIEKNQTQTANALQQQAEESLKDMLKSLEEGQKKREEELRRVLADLKASLKRLVEQQDTQIAALAAAVRDQKLQGLDVPMITLHESTLAVKEQLAASRELAAAAAPAGDAGDSQSVAISALREAAPATAAADVAERTSLQKLKEALTQIEEMEKKTQEDDLAKQREELRKAYEESLAKQRQAQRDAAPLVEASRAGKDLSRRERQTARELAAAQESIRTELYTLKEKTKGLDEAKVFEYAHTRIDAASKETTSLLADGTAPATVARDQATIVRTLESLIESLKETKGKDDFREAGGGGGGEGGGGGKKPKAIPPIAELKLLRMMQEEALEMTRTAADSNDLDALKAAAQLQNELTAQAKNLVDRMQEQDSGGPDVAPDKKEVPK